MVASSVEPREMRYPTTPILSVAAPQLTVILFAATFVNDKPPGAVGGWLSAVPDNVVTLSVAALDMLLASSTARTEYWYCVELVSPVSVMLRSVVVVMLVPLRATT